METLNGFPYGNFHGQRVKEHVFQPDWTTPERFEYTCNLFRILARIGDENADRLTVSTLPASHSWFHAEEERMFSRLDAMSGFLDVLSILNMGIRGAAFGTVTAQAVVVMAGCAILWKTGYRKWSHEFTHSASYSV